MCGSRLLRAGALVFAVGCNVSDANGPDEGRVVILTITGGHNQIAAPGTLLSDPITVRLRDLTTGNPVKSRGVTFRAPAGSGIELEPSRVMTDSAGEAAVSVTLGPEYGRYEIAVSLEGNSAAPSWVAVEAAHTPVVTSVSPSEAQPDDEITITGEHFGVTAQTNDVRIGGVRATVVSATPTQLQVRVPNCVDTGMAQVSVRRGSLVSGFVLLAVSGTPVETVTLSAGEPVLTVNNLTCLRLSAQAEDAQYLIVPVNAATEGSAGMNVRLVGSSALAVPTADVVHADLAAASRVTVRSLQGNDVRTEFESRLRRREADLVQRMPPVARRGPAPALRLEVPELGDARQFNVFAPYFGFDQVTAIVRGLGQHVIIYVDQDATDVTASDMPALVRLFDEVIFPTDLEVFGQPSDLDQNGRVVVLLTAAVNRLTPPGSSGYIAGYFYGCDLLPVEQCAESNLGEVLYSMVPDPSGSFGIRHTREHVMRIMPAIVAHELQHAIHFNKRVLEGGLPSLDAVWMAEALAHTAEDTVAAVLRSRGDTVAARDMTRENYRRAAFYLSAPQRTSLVEVNGGGSIEGRGAGWLLLKYLRARAGGDILGQLTAARDLGSANVTAVTGLEWTSLLRDWASALYAAGAPELNGSTPPATHTFGTFDLRAAISGVANGKYPLTPIAQNGSSFAHEVWLPASAPSYLLISTPAHESLTLSMTGPAGRAFTAQERPNLAILRLR